MPSSSLCSFCQKEEAKIVIPGSLTGKPKQLCWMHYYTNHYVYSNVDNKTARLMDTTDNRSKKSKNTSKDKKEEKYNNANNTTVDESFLKVQTLFADAFLELQNEISQEEARSQMKREEEKRKELKRKRDFQIKMNQKRKEGGGNDFLGSMLNEPSSLSATTIQKRRRKLAEKKLLKQQKQQQKK